MSNVLTVGNSSQVALANPFQKDSNVADNSKIQKAQDNSDAKATPSTVTAKASPAPSKVADDATVVDNDIKPRGKAVDIKV